MNKIIKIIYVLVGFIAMGLGIIGIILPVLPTTPFLLLASVCFMRGSERLNTWFKSTKIYKKHLESFIKDRTLTLKQKVIILLFADFMIAFPLIITNNIFMKIVLIFIILCKYYYFIFKIKTKKILKVDYQTEEI
ncbi:YbaN family protein [Clostridium tagluense]|uniref:YbaN family protein n=1 Tax=Clostridium TaxID=1485 RepID=UPI0013E95B4F|nr:MULTISPECIES: YbaN family protein [Clostridium]MBZ9623430.1 YbaN family protein [Clostridium sp. FP2]MCB2310913.1 YbaN family protein [Clostridium tagluense]MCB2315767.1 YbaN family protein [Clostridium tagluense]MCB2320589.1 YbaN family protein [Clostridium tagluense]MCB2325506.1 YbaN family protein [Clostridium tagluense]